jgi:hypothetical protein
VCRAERARSSARNGSEGLRSSFAARDTLGVVRHGLARSAKAVRPGLRRSL